MAVLSEKQFLLAAGAAIVGVVVVSWAGKKAVIAAADASKGIVTGENALTQDTPYEGTGILGTLGAATNAASGGTLQTIGENIGETLFNWFGPKVEINDTKPGQVIDGEYKVLQQFNSEN